MRSKQGPGWQGLNRLWREILRLIFFTSCRIEVVHRERTSRPGPWILVSNHISHFDPPLWSLMARRPLDWMAMEELFAQPVFAWLLRGVGAFAVRRGTADRGALRVAGERLGRGRVVAIFPEGGIRDGERSIIAGAALRPGAALLAYHHKVPVLPCVILGSDRLYNKRSWWPFRRTPVWAICGEFLEPDGADFASRGALEEALAASFPALASELCKTCRLVAADLPHPPQVRMAEPSPPAR